MNLKYSKKYIVSEGILELKNILLLEIYHTSIKGSHNSKINVKILELLSTHGNFHASFDNCSINKQFR